MAPASPFQIFSDEIQWPYIVNAMAADGLGPYTNMD